MAVRILDTYLPESKLFIDFSNIESKEFLSPSDRNLSVGMISVLFNADGTAGNRRLRIQWVHSTGLFSVAQFVSPVEQTPNTSVQYILSENNGANDDAISSASQIYFSLPAWDLAPGDRLFFDDQNSVSTNDTLHYTINGIVWVG